MRRPIDRPVAAGRISQTLNGGGASAGVSAANDSPLGSSCRISATHLDGIGSVLTDTDWEVLNFVSACRLASGKQLVRQFFSATDHDVAAARAGRRALKKLADKRVLDPLPRRTIGGLRGGSDTLVYGVGVAGARLLARRGLTQRRLGTPGDRYVAHTLAVTELAVQLQEADRVGVLELIERQFEPACWRGFIGRGGMAVRLKPDLFVRVGAGRISEDRWMIEIDRATEASGTIRTKAQRHLDYWASGCEPVHPRILWVVPDERRASQIADILRPLPAPAERLFAICLAPETVGFLAEEARA